MRKTRQLFVIPAILLSTLLAYAVRGEPSPAARSGNEFALALYEQLADAESGKNLFFSPTSISTALAMAYGGAKGATATEMRKALHFELDGARLHAAMGTLARSLTARTEGYELALANALWGQKGYPFLESFLDLNQKYYGARLEELDFQTAHEEARVTINRWVEQQTNDRIKDLLARGSVTPATRLVLTNAIYFKGSWKVQFDPEHTRTETFHLASAGEVKVPLMHLRDQRFPYLQETDFQALELPYAGERISMLILLPGEESSLAQLENSLSVGRLDEWIQRMASRKLDEVALPRFTATTQYELTSPLARLGMSSAFSRTADFSGMARGEGLFISDVVHKAFVAINEEGTEAAAATAVGIRATAFRPPERFLADRPFVYLIRDRETGTILFMGRVVDPS